MILFILICLLEYIDYEPVQTTVVLSEEVEYSLVSVALVNDDISERRKNFYGTIDTNHTSIAVMNNESEVVIKDDEGNSIWQV